MRATPRKTHTTRLTLYCTDFREKGRILRFRASRRCDLCDFFLRPFDGKRDFPPRGMLRKYQPSIAHRLRKFRF